MRLHFTTDWLRKKIAEDADIDCEAGIPLQDASVLERFVRAPERKSAVLNVLVHQLRRKDGLTAVQLASRIQVDVAEIEAIETNVNYVPRPRTLHQLASYMKVPTQAVQSLTVDAIAKDHHVSEAALRFAASSKDLSALTSSERRGFNDFVKFLASYKGSTK
jgi:transcriptional regulator with XRE-family HTH domain